MHQTTVRFTDDLWEQLEREAARTGVSAAQYVRDATLSRLAYTAGQRGDGMFAEPKGVSRATRAAEDARERQEGSAAVWAQARLARERAQRLRDRARETHSQGRGS
jgi:hypothetical protein